MDLVSYLLGKKAGGGTTPVDNMIHYTEEEQEIGTWIDGSKVYRKVVTYTNEETIGTKTGVTNYTIAHGIENFGNIIKIDGFDIISGAHVLLPIFSGSSGDYAKGLYFGTCISNVTSTDIYLRIINDTYSSRDWVFILEYTKTEPAPEEAKKEEVKESILEDLTR